MSQRFRNLPFSCDPRRGGLEIGHINTDPAEHVLSHTSVIHSTRLDISAAMNEQAKKLNKAFVDQERASFPLYGGEALPLPDHEFHKMMSVNTIYFWEYPLTIFEECPRLLAYAKYGFCLHGWDDVEQPVIQASFQIADTQTETEAIERKDGLTVERTFTTITLKA